MRERKRVKRGRVRESEGEEDKREGGIEEGEAEGQAQAGAEKDGVSRGVTSAGVGSGCVRVQVTVSVRLLRTDQQVYPARREMRRSERRERHNTHRTLLEMRRGERERERERQPTHSHTRSSLRLVKKPRLKSMHTLHTVNTPCPLAASLLPA